MFSTLQVFGYISGILTGIGTLPYIFDILRLKTKPERASWLIWTVLILIQFFSQLNKGATYSLWLSGVQAVEITLVFILSIKFGIGGLHRKDYGALIGASIGLIAWYFTKEAAIALLLELMHWEVCLLLKKHIAIQKQRLQYCGSVHLSLGYLQVSLSES